jgi:hypothetical protein
MITIDDRQRNMSQQELLDRIGQEGDALLKRKLSRVNAEGDYVPIEAGTTRPVLLIAKLFAYLEQGGPAAVVLAVPALPLLAPIDLIHVILRFVLFPFVLLAWWLERRLAQMLGRSFFCPLCSNPMREPLVYCPKCKRVQPRLRPHPEALFIRTCECGEMSWPILGQFFLRCPQPLVCRDTERVTGCYRPHALAVLAGRGRSRHVAVAGTTARAKHAVMAHLFEHLAQGDGPLGQWEPAWDMSALELELFEQTLSRSFQIDTSDCDKLGERYTLALSFVLRKARGSQLYVFHNVAQHWLDSTPLLIKNVLNWKLTHGMIFVLDPEQMGLIADSDQLPQAEAYSRLLRVIEEFCRLQAGSTLPLRVAVVLPVPDGQAATLGVPGVKSGLSGEAVQKLVREKEPALHALLIRSVAPAKLGFFAGPIPDDLDLKKTKWLHDVLTWVR